jgi:hypothetical protein
MHHFLDGIAKRVVEKTAENPNACWPDTIMLLHRLPIPYLETIVTQLYSDIPLLSDDKKLKVVEELRKSLFANSLYPPRPKKLPQEIIAQLKDIFRLLEPDCEIKRNLFLFNLSFPPIASESKDFNEFLREVEERKQAVIESIWNEKRESGIEDIIASVEKPENIGIILAHSSFTDTIENHVLDWLGDENKAFDLAARQFVHIRAILSASWTTHIADDNFLSWNLGKKVAFCLGLPPSKATYTFIESLDDEIKEGYWKTTKDFPLDKECVNWVIRQYLKYSQPLSALDVAGLFLIKTNIDPDLVADSLEAFAALDIEKDITQHRNLANIVISLIKFLESNDSISDERLGKIEIQYIRTFRDNEIKPRVVLKEIFKKPEFFVDLICMAYKANPELPNEFSDLSSKQVKHRAKLALCILDTIHELPGQDEGRVDSDRLYEWVESARSGCKQKNRLIIGDEIIGQILSYSPQGKDGIWPLESVRNVIEKVV